MNETTTGAPLTATLGERVGDDPHVKEVREEVEHTSAERSAQQAGATQEPPAAQQGSAMEGRPGSRRASGRPFPWASLALAVVGWALLTGLGRGIRARARRVGRGARRLARR
jgi:hypothetical protein